MKRKLITGIMLLVYVAGFLFLAYPDIQHFRNFIAAKRDIKAFYEMEKMVLWEEDSVMQEESEVDADDYADANTTGEEVPVGNPYATLQEHMQAYNEEIYQNGQKHLADPWAYEVSSFNLREYGLDSDVVAVLSVASMGVELPVYLGASAENMERGAVHLSQTSLPIGGTNTNAVIAAHRGYNGIPMFRDIEKVSPGDVITITNLWESLTYQVTDIMIIEPHEVDKVLVQKGKDMLTLLTCHPYRSNTQRYVVFCERVTDEALQASGETASSQVPVTEEAYLLETVVQEPIQIPETTSQQTIIEAVENETVSESANAVREAAMRQDADTIRMEEILRMVGYVLYLIVGVAIVISFVAPKKEDKAGKEES